ncbi:uncharacterized protein L969DRAFT_88790 [Mixia osmundae IAM 14324]|uniref:Nitrate/nitrite transporter n=1 Tax=Mixia osmundae (strain CBS 9802 / IAM 14324 / JCM 22182 / KY 12970) TaxID=764103 RepID=G7E0I6_MIXOS|nr:uncharacterized protein L969DRAFT_88790 [Mixia osmundae IAM 14324]KEI38356.1 hypothetical protein L969DRAFT_88790 [Mixia osmundae IAM 14324]GAA96346.1 hypothetical protein E5Q_03012 [Mixia osmundae IAM 14324]
MSSSSPASSVEVNEKAQQQLKEQNTHDAIDGMAVSEQTKQGLRSGMHGPPKFSIKQLFSPPVINPTNLKSQTLCIFHPNRYALAFHLSWLGFFVAFLSWFAFPPLIPEIIRTDLKLTAIDVANSNIVSLSATLGVRWIVGPFVDRFGPRYVMASLLIIGAIPSGLAGTAHNAHTLYVLRFFIGILGGTFVPCQAWTTCFFDKNVVGTANALVGGWGNAGGGATFAIMVALYTRLLKDTTPHVAWRAAFAAVPVPVLFFVAALTLIFGPDHPAGKWSQRHTTPASAIAMKHGHQPQLDHSERAVIENKMTTDKEAQPGVQVRPADAEEEAEMEANVKSEVDIAVNEKLTMKSFVTIISDPLTWLPAVSYLTSFGAELFVDSNVANIIFAIFKTTSFTSITAGYWTSSYGLLNIITRPLGGLAGDLIYRKFGVAGKKYLMLGLGMANGLVFIGLGQYLKHHPTIARGAHLPTFMGLLLLSAIFDEMGNGAAFALVPHTAVRNNGLQSGLVGGMGNLGGIFFNLVIRYQTETGKAIWIIGIVVLIANAILLPIKTPKY